MSSDGGRDLPGRFPAQWLLVELSWASQPAHLTNAWLMILCDRHRAERARLLGEEDQLWLAFAADPAQHWCQKCYAEHLQAGRQDRPEVSAATWPLAQVVTKEHSRLSDQRALQL